MANIVELREMSDDRLNEMLENAREEMFNLRFQNTSARLEDYSRLKQVRREIAQLQTVLNMRNQALEEARKQPEIAALLVNVNYQATARFSYENSAWEVEFMDEDGNQIASAMVDLNKKRLQGRNKRKQKKQPRLNISFEISG